MRRGVSWTERDEERGKCEVYVTFPGGGRIQWQFRWNGGPGWDHATAPTVEQWETLLDHMEARVRRGIGIEELPLVKRALAEARQGQ